MSARPGLAQANHRPIHSLDEIAWQQHASCHGAPDHWFFPPPKTPVSQTVTDLCNACPVKQQCLQFAIEYGEQHGVWGGLTSNQRRRLAEHKSPPTPGSNCGTPAGYQRHSKRRENPCTRCRRAHNAQMRAIRAQQRQGATA